MGELVGEGLEQDIPSASTQIPEILGKRRRSVEIEEVEDEEAPQICGPSPSQPSEPNDDGSNVLPALEIWEDELNESIEPSAEIQDWGTLRD